LNPPDKAVVVSVDEKTQSQALARTYQDIDLHVIVDNSSTHSTPEAMQWLAANPRVSFHFTPTSAGSTRSRVSSASSPADRFVGRASRARPLSGVTSPVHRCRNSVNARSILLLSS
jgi:hypothetical protein